MKKIFFITIFLIFSLTQKSYSYSSDPKQFISEIVEEAKGILVESNTKEFKTNKLSEIALKTVDIKGIAYYTLGGYRKELSEEQMKKYLDKINIYYHQSDLIKTISNIEGIDFISLSDVPSYFSGELERSFYQKIKKSLSNDGVSVNRNYLRVPNAKKDGLLDISKKFNSPIKKECVQMYRVEVMQREF